jgi:transaldolase
MNATYFRRVAAATPTRFWINNPTLKQTELALEAGAAGCTQNPSFVYKMLSDPMEKYRALSMLDSLDAAGKDADQMQEALQRALVADTARRFLPLYEQSGGTMGYVSIQGNPLREDKDTIVRSAIYNREAGENIMAKVPATEDGLAALAELIPAGIPINATEVMCTRQVLELCDIYDKATRGMRNPPVVYFSHITGIFDEYLQKYVTSKGLAINPDSLWQAGMIAARKAYLMVQERGLPIGFIGGGARGLHHFTEMVGADCCITINWAGAADKLLEMDPPVVDRFNRPVSEGVLDQLLTKVDEFRRAWMSDGVEPHDFEEFGPVVLFRDSFVSAWEKANIIIGKHCGLAVKEVGK